MEPAAGTRGMSVRSASPGAGRLCPPLLTERAGARGHNTSRGRASIVKASVLRKVINAMLAISRADWTMKEWR